MKQFAPALSLVILIISGSCRHTVHRMFDHDAHHHRVNRMETDINGDMIRIDYWGSLIFNKEGSEIEAISPDGFLEYIHNNVIIYAANDTSGRLAYDIYDAGKRIDYHMEGKAIINKAVKEMIGIGFNAKARISQLYSLGGVQQVLAEMEQIDNTSVKTTYFACLLNDMVLAPAQKDLVVERLIVTDLPGHEKVQLVKHLTQSDFANPATTKIYLQLVNSIDTEFDRARFLKKFIDNQPMNPEIFDSIMNITSNINAEIERISIIKKND